MRIHAPLHSCFLLSFLGGRRGRRKEEAGRNNAQGERRREGIRKELEKRGKMAYSIGNTHRQ